MIVSTPQGSVWPTAVMAPVITLWVAAAKAWPGGASRPPLWLFVLMPFSSVNFRGGSSVGHVSIHTDASASIEPLQAPASCALIGETVLQLYLQTFQD